MAESEHPEESTGSGHVAVVVPLFPRLPGLRHTGRLAEGSRFEAPTSVISTVPTGAFLEVGAFCNLSGGTINNARFGRYCSLASGVVIGPHEHPTDWLTTSRTAYFPEVNGWDALLAEDRIPAIKARKRPFAGSCPITEIGPDAWIGQGAFIKAGVTIGAPMTSDTSCRRAGLVDWPRTWRTASSTSSKPCRFVKICGAPPTSPRRS